MKKTMFVCRPAAAAVAALALGMTAFVGCEEFDDSAIQQSLSDLNSRVDELEEAVTDLQNQINAINSMLDGGKIIKSITPSSDGLQYVITYLGEGVPADIIKVGEATEAPSVTILEEGGVYYWGKLDENGYAEHLLGADNKIPVKTEIPEARAPKFSVDEQGNLQVSIDGGETFVDAGIKISDVTAPIFKDVTVGEGEVTFTLQDDSTFTVPMTVELTCDIVSGRVVFQLSERKNIPVDASGYENYEVAVPYGWTANFNGTYIEVIAPAASDKALSGELVLRVYAGDRVKMDKININVGAQNIHVSTGLNEAGAATVTVATSYDMPFYIGAVKLSEYSAEAAAQAAQPEVYTSADGVYRHHTTATENEDGSFTYVPCTLLFTDLVADPVPGEEYVIWTFEHPDDYRLAPENIQTYLFVYGQSVSVTVSDVTFHSASISIVPGEETAFFYGIYPYDEFYRLGEEEGKAGVAKMLNDYPDSYSYTKTVSGSFTDLCSYRVIPGGKYVLYYALDNLGDGANYVASDIMLKDIEFTPLTYDSPLSVTLGNTVTATSSEVSVPFEAPATGVYEVYVDYISEADWTGKYAETDRNVIDDILATVWPFSGEASSTISESGLAPETTGYLVAFLVDDQGRISKLSKIQATTKAQEAASEFYEGATISLTSEGNATLNGWSAVLSFADNSNFVAGENLYLIYYFQPVGQKDGFASAEEVKIAMDNNPNSSLWDYGSFSGNRVNIKSVTASETTYNVSLTGLDAGTEYMFVASLVKTTEVIGDAGGITSQTIEGYVTANFTTLPAGQTYEAGSAEWEAMKPTVTVSSAVGTDMATATIEVKLAEGTDLWWGCDTDAASASKTIDEVKDMLNGYSYTGDKTLRAFMFDGVGCVFYITWTDTKGNSYEPMRIEIPYPAE